ncbi:sulfite exporter TauE/SafE family protein [Vibrio sp. DW001]|uniref:sulfite exporter TauE/SafE family protein n=1 Tax=Vibrio sp. DW001 TaxID=2912315 RepID=UPI0023B10B0B|nr:sulfite exporter TauE/SafE family protein [Vibrio sp. DW001]WED28749.1 sulfite exporter TauE/SafE family protein [Vibrio sp. DW001]
MDNISIILLILFVSNLVQSTFSFGGALVAIPLLVMCMDVSSAAVLLTMMSLTISTYIVVTGWRSIDLMSSATLVVSSSIGIPIGVYFVIFADESTVKTLLAISIGLFALTNLLRLFESVRPNTKFALLFGFISGVLGGAYNISGPPVVMYGVLSGWSPEKFRATIQSFALKTNLLAFLTHLVAGNITETVWCYYYYSLPILVICMWLGRHIHQRIAAADYRKYINLILIALSMNLIWSVL